MALSTWAQVTLTAVLVGITAFYAWQTKRMAEEMERARSAQIIPKLVPNVRVLGAGQADLRLQNVGPGPALDVDVEFVLEPGGPSRRWRRPVVAPGEGYNFPPAPEEPNGLRDLDALTARYQSVRLTWTLKDALGQVHQVDERLDIAEFWTARKAVKELFPHDRLRVMAGHLEGIGKNLKGLLDVAKRAERRLDDEG